MGLIGMMDAASLVFDVHGMMLRTLCKAGDKHYQGLSVAASDSYRKGMITLRQKHRMIAVDHAFQIIRHITTVSVQKDYDELSVILEKSAGGDGEKHRDDPVIDAKTEKKENSAQAGDSCNTGKRRKCDGDLPPATDNNIKQAPADTVNMEVMDHKIADVELMIQKVRRESLLRYDDSKKTLDGLLGRCEQLAVSLVDQKEEVMLQVKAQEVISAVIRAEKAKECDFTHRRLEHLEQKCSDILETLRPICRFLADIPRGTASK